MSIIIIYSFKDKKAEIIINNLTKKYSINKIVEFNDKIDKPNISDKSNTIDKNNKSPNNKRL